MASLSIVMGFDVCDLHTVVKTCFKKNHECKNTYTRTPKYHETLVEKVKKYG